MKNYIISAWLVFFAMRFSMCQKEGSSLSVTGISPDHGIQLATVKITGHGFAERTRDNLVKFNGVPAFIHSRLGDTLIVEVPKSAGTGNVTVTVNGKTTTGPVFNYTYSATVSTFAGTGVQGKEDGQGVNAAFNRPEGITTDVQGNIYVSDTYNHLIRKITPAGMVTTVTGSFEGNDDGLLYLARFRYPLSAVTDAAGKIYVADMYNHRIRVIAGGSVTTLAGKESGYSDGQGSNARFKFPVGIAIDKAGNLYVADNGNHMVRKVTPQGDVTSVAGGVKGYADGTDFDEAKFDHPFGIAVDSAGTIYVTEKGNHCVRRITAQGVQTLAGNGTPGYVEGEGLAAKLFGPAGIALHPSGDLFVADTDNHVIRRIKPDGTVSTVAGIKEDGYADGIGAAARFSYPMALAIVKTGIIYITDKNSRVRKILME